MNYDLTEARIRKTLIEWISDEFLIDEMHSLEPEHDSDGNVITVSESIRRKYQSRLEGLQRVAPLRTDLHDQCRSVLRVLDGCDLDETFYYWEAHSDLWNYAGVSTPKRVVEFLFHGRAKL